MHRQISIREIGSGMSGTRAKVGYGGLCAEDASLKGTLAVGPFGCSNPSLSTVAYESIPLLREQILRTRFSP